MPEFRLYLGDCLDILPTLPADSVDSIVTDPPYGLSFMGKDWDHGVPGIHFWQEIMRVAKPGAHLLAFGGTRTHHRLMCAIEDAGWEIRDTVMWVYGSGFPKSHDVSKAIDKAAGVQREVIGQKRSGLTMNASLNDDGWHNANGSEQNKRIDVTAPATDAARQWAGWGTALKPAWEPIILARKPLVGTVAENVTRYGTGALNIDGCRVGVTRDVPASLSRCKTPNGVFGDYGGGHPRELDPKLGRWPANLIHDGSEEVVGGFPANAPSGGGFKGSQKSMGLFAGFKGNSPNPSTGGDSGSAARFFYCAKASKKDRGDGNAHPTVKPTDLMRYLCRLVTPPGGVVLDPFMGSGSTGKAAMLEGFRFVGIELDPDYHRIAEERIRHANRQPSLFGANGAGG